MHHSVTNGFGVLGYNTFLKTSLSRTSVQFALKKAVADCEQWSFRNLKEQQQLKKHCCSSSAVKQS